MSKVIPFPSNRATTTRCTDSVGSKISNNFDELLALKSFEDARDQMQGIVADLMAICAALETQALG
ncbi:MULTISPECIES: hypothetical protein [unclassified Rhizobium]|uniref:hypothetical protein n=1 Tax=unclassified Rhizobium TaxID=2613769 RepID=UPI0024795B9C|nr:MULTISPECIES: hypothetical protein [unclassified Rhizobium]MDH7804539.1 hypothetical protein [Rhizobium sp. AN70]